MNNFEKKFGKYAIRNLTTVLIICYVIGYLIELLLPNLLIYLTLDPYAILHGQVWRLVSWILIPPTSIGSGGNIWNLFLTFIMLYFYYSLGTSLERTWGTYRYNVYLLGGILFTVVASFITLPIMYVLAGSEGVAAYMAYGSLFYSTYYVNMSIFLAFAATFPNAQVLLMMIFPVKVKWLGIIYGVMLVSEALTARNIFTFCAIGASLLNFVVFYYSSRKHLHPKQIKRRMQYQQEVRRARPVVTKHKCAICGRTDEDDATLEFRFCSKCNGNYEYCQNHLFTHEHVK